MDMKEIAWKSWDVYKKNFLKLVIPFLVLAMVATLALGLARDRATEVPEGKTTVVAGDNLNSPDFLDVNDGVYFEVEAIGNEDVYGLDIIHESNAIPITQIAGGWIGVDLNFKSENTATYHLKIYNFATAGWENIQSGIVGEIEVAGGGIIKTSPADYIHDSENYIRIRLYTTNEENAHRLQEDHLIYWVIEPTQPLEIGISYLALLFSLVFCFGITIGITRKALQGKLVKFSDALRITGLNYIHMSVAALLLLIPLSILLYAILTQFWGTILIPFALLLLFFSVYTWHGIIIRSYSPLSSIKHSFQVTWDNVGITLILWVMLALVWISFYSLPYIGLFMSWFFLPFWTVMLSVTYMDRTDELLKTGVAPENSGSS